MSNIGANGQQGKKIIAVIFGGRSVEHDVSILTGLQFIEALDPVKYSAMPVYVDPMGQWWTGDALLARGNYPIKENANLTQIKLDLSHAIIHGRPAFTVQEKGFLGVKEKTIVFDLMVPAIHGSNGEDGSLQGLLSFAAVPYAGCRQLSAAQTMDKFTAKNLARAAGITVLPDVLVARPAKGQFIEEDFVKRRMMHKFTGYDYPYIVKPRNLGSSVGVSRVENFDDLMAALLKVFKLDSHAMIEPCVTPLVEYNVAVKRGEDGQVHCSAVEKPLSGAELLDFKNKYLRGAKGGAAKIAGAKQASSSEGMASLSREINPADLTSRQKNIIRDHAHKIFDLFDLAGSIRIDFLCNGNSGDIWFNEVNSIPGSFAYFLWEAAEKPIGFLDLTHEMIEEGFRLSRLENKSTSSSAGNSSIFGD